MIHSGSFKKQFGETNIRFAPWFDYDKKEGFRKLIKAKKTPPGLGKNSKKAKIEKDLSRTLIS